jgi:hypothetical protein
MVKLVEHCAGTGDLLHRDQVVRQVRYDFSVFQGMSAGSGLPIPGQRTLKGCIDYEPAKETASCDLVGPVLTLRLEDGRHVGIRLTGEGGGIAEGRHGIGAGCQCC